MSVTGVYPWFSFQVQVLIVQQIMICALCPEVIENRITWTSNRHPSWIRRGGSMLVWRLLPSYSGSNACHTDYFKCGTNIVYSFDPPLSFVTCQWNTPHELSAPGIILRNTRYCPVSCIPRIRQLILDSKFSAVYPLCCIRYCPRFYTEFFMYTRGCTGHPLRVKRMNWRRIN